MLRDDLTSLSDSLKTVIDVSKFFSDEIKMEAYDIAKQIYEGNNRNGRDLETITKHTFYGLVSEYALCETLGLKANKSSDLWYDIYNEDFKFEIKVTTKAVKYWSIGWNDSMNRSRYDYFLQHSDKIDFIIWNYLDVENREMYPKVISNAKTFENFMVKSQYNEGHWYNKEDALLAGQCRILN